MASCTHDGLRSHLGRMLSMMPFASVCADCPECGNTVEVSYSD